MIFLCSAGNACTVAKRRNHSSKGETYILVKGLVCTQGMRESGKGLNFTGKNSSFATKNLDIVLFEEIPLLKNLVC